MKAKIGAGVLVALLAFLGIREGVRYTPYRDTGSVITVCRGITGPAVIPGKTYTEAECQALETEAATKFLQAVYDCAGVPLSDGEAVAYASLAYNTGAESFCRSTIVRLLKAGDHHAACRQIPRWHFVAGKDCTDPKNNCRGIVLRREAEMRMCLGL